MLHASHDTAHHKPPILACSRTNSPVDAERLAREMKSLDLPLSTISNAYNPRTREYPTHLIEDGGHCPVTGWIYDLMESVI